MCSATRGDLVTRLTSTYFGARSFAVAGSTAWNQLPADDGVGQLFTARCYAELVRPSLVRPSVRPSVCLSVTLMYRGHIGWNFGQLIVKQECLAVAEKLK